MKQTTSLAQRHLESVDTTPVADIEDPTAAAIARRAELRDRHTRNLQQLMELRRDLRGVNQLADFVDDAIRWTA